MHKRTILIVDDDNDILECLRDVLESEGYETMGATNGKNALDLLEGPVKPKLILLDLMMPVMNASEFIENTRKSQILSKIPAVIMSASNFTEQKVADLRVDGHIKKPFNFDELLNTVKRFCA